MRKTDTPFFAVLAFVALAATVAGCNNSGYSAAPGATSTPFPLPTASCTTASLPAGESVQMVFPQNNGTQQANLQGIVVAVSPAPLPTDWYFYVTSSLGSTLGTQQIGFLATPSPQPTASAGATAAPTGTPLPTPSDTPLFANPIYEIASIGTFATSTQFKVFLASSKCVGLALSTFTTSSTDLPTPTPTPSPTGT